MAIVNIKLSFLDFINTIGMYTAYRYHNNALGGYNSSIKTIILNLPLILEEIRNPISLYAQNKTFEQLLCYVLTHEEIHAWLDKNEGSSASMMFDNIAIKFMRGM